ncbi:MAG: germination protein YpeB [Oscillospiraceae bacterium]|nr:germination protein YpeB [Oscillospiraceae bacterium]
MIYSLAAIAALGGLTAMSRARLEYCRQAADYSSAAALDETVSAVAELSSALKKLRYVTDDVLGRSICSKAYAEAMRAEAAMSVLPFSTQELEKLSGFLNLAGDYSASLLAQSEDELSEEQKQHVQQLSDAAADFSARLSQLQTELNDGSISMDSMEQRRFARGDSGSGTELFSSRMLSYEEEFTSPEEFVYEGKYSPRQEAPAGELSEEESKAIAAQAAGVEPRELKEEYSYEGSDGRRCYSAGELRLCVSSRGLESMSQSRLVSAGGMDQEQARQRAEDFLASLGYSELGLSGENFGETMAVYHFAPERDGALVVDDYISVSVALDDGSIYSYDATRYREADMELLWNIDEDSARRALPEGAEPQSTRKLIISTPGGNYLPCWEFICGFQEDERMCIYVDAESGKQCKIERCR